MSDAYYHPVGRRGKATSLTPDAHKAVTEMLQAGAYFETACLAAGVSKYVGKSWMRRGRDCIAWEQEHGVRIEDEEDRIFIDFVDACERATAIAEIHALAQLRRGDANWQAQAWFLERRIPQHWRRRESVDSPGRLEEPETLIQIRNELASAGIDDLDAELRFLLADGGDD